jgi:hypothetical protein
MDRILDCRCIFDPLVSNATDGSIQKRARGETMSGARLVSGRRT